MDLWWLFLFLKIWHSPQTSRFSSIFLPKCLRNPTTSESSDHKELSISAASNNMTVRGYDNNDGVTTRHIEIAHPSGCSFVVVKY